MLASDSAPNLSVSVIIPARNEEACLEACLRSLVTQEGLTFEVIVVDDGSEDRTRQIAASFPEVRIVDPPPLPDGWSGKNNAVSAGAGKASGEWLLFTDADTVHRPGSLAGALAEARDRRASLLSYSPQQDVRGFWEMAVMPVIFAELALTYRPSSVSNPSSPAAAANGQYLLISREAYDAVGGHAAIAGSLLEDVALARAVKKSGRKIHFRYGADAVRTRMYRSFAQLREGWTKNLALLFPSPVRLAVLRSTEFVLLTSTAGLAMISVLQRRGAMTAIYASVTLFLWGLFFTRIRKAHFHLAADVAAVFGLPLFSYLLLRSRLAHKKGSVCWKGRSYPSLTVPSAEGTLLHPQSSLDAGLKS